MRPIRHIALGVWARCLLMIVCQVAGSARAEESDGMYTSRGAKLWVDSYSQVWTLGRDGTSVSCHMKVLWAKDRNDAFDNVYKSILDKSSVQKVKEGSLVVRGRRDATSESLDTAGPELKYSTYVDGDVLFIRVIFASDDWATHSLDVKYEITNAVCSAYSSSAQEAGAVLHQFHAPWSNWWKVPVRSPISYTWILPPPASQWGQDSPMLLSPPASFGTTNREEDREGTGAGAGLVVQRILTPDELGIGSSSTGMADVIFAWVPLKPYKNQEQNWHGASNYEGADPDVRACSSGGDHTPSCRVCVFIIWPFLFAMPMICCMCAYSMCMRAFRPPPPLPTDIPLQAVFVNVSPARDERLVERIQALPTSLEPPANGDVCGICLESQADAPWRLLPCGHRFHMSCVDEWLSTAKGCPTCRMDPCPAMKEGQEEPVPAPAPLAPQSASAVVL